MPDTVSTTNSAASITDQLRADLLHTQQSRQSLRNEITSLQRRDKELLLREQRLSTELSQLLPSSSPDTSRPDPKPISSRPPSRFLTPAESALNQGKTIALASYPRCGSSLLRSLLEKLTGIATGSDSDPNRALIRQLQAMGFQGEGVTDGRVLAVKTHFPERLGHERFKCGRVIILVRNPFDAIVSYFNMVLTQTHTKSIKRSEFVKYEEIWREFVKEEIECWKEFYRQWLAVEETPKLVLRYEDLVQNRREAVGKMVDFMRDLRVEGTDFAANVDQVCGEELAKAGVYAPRSVGLMQDEGKEVVGGSAGEMGGTGAAIAVGSSFLSSKDIYCQEQVEYVLASARELLVALGYWENLPAEWTESVPATMRKRRCLVASTEGEYTQVVLNSRYGIRPRTKDDPNGRGFGKRWKRRLAMLPPVQMTNGRNLEWKQINFNSCQYG